LIASRPTTLNLTELTLVDNKVMIGLSLVNMVAMQPRHQNAVLFSKTATGVTT